MMRLIENWKEVAKWSLSMWCWYIGATAGALHLYIMQTPAGALQGSWLQTLDGWALAVAFLAGFFAGPGRMIAQPKLARPKE